MRIISAFLAAILGTSLLGAQVVARQGDPSELPSQEFKSPMILELPLKGLAPLKIDDGMGFNEVQKYYCDDSVISKLVVMKRSHRGGGLKLEIRGAITVRPSRDRLATIRFDVIKGEQVLGTAQVARINAEEGQTSTFKSGVSLTAEQTGTLFDDAAPALLRVTVVIADNS